ncbi:MAG TPA: hypothetical protein DIT07_12800 [Sphingobacteriaceae bacterium]|nr:hypothetical protein [Sphingobacteriaceae bacterium]
MNQVQPNIQKSKATWTDETGTPIPFNRLSKSEKLKEQLSGVLFKKALKNNQSLLDLKKEIDQALFSVRESLLEDKLLHKTTKGNFTWYNFDRSIKIEVNVNETITFDEGMIAAARECLDSFISKNVQGTDEVVRTLINSAFHNTKGGLDSKKVLSLIKYRTKIKAADFQRALNLIEQSVSRPSSKRYFRIWAKDAAGQYQNIDLNFSSI